MVQKGHIMVQKSSERRGGSTPPPSPVPCQIVVARLDMEAARRPPRMPTTVAPSYAYESTYD